MLVQNCLIFSDYEAYWLGLRFSRHLDINYVYQMSMNEDNNLTEQVLARHIYTQFWTRVLTCRDASGCQRRRVT
jgi:hypothetical protein